MFSFSSIRIFGLYDLKLFTIIHLICRFATHESAATAIVKCNGMEMDGCYIKVSQFINCCFYAAFVIACS